MANQALSRQGYSHRAASRCGTAIAGGRTTQQMVRKVQSFLLAPVGTWPQPAKYLTNALQQRSWTCAFARQLHNP